MAIPQIYTNEREVWDCITGPTHKDDRGVLYRKFNELFPDGHKTSIRPFVECWEESPEFRKKCDEHKCLDDMHHKVFGLLARYGKDYTPFVWKRHPRFPEEPLPGQCSRNSSRIMHHENGIADKKPHRYKERVVYVEGITYGSLLAPTLHAWNARGLTGTVAYDWSHYAIARWGRYLGIPLTQEEFIKAGRLITGRNYLQMLFKKEFFPKAENFLIDILENRCEEEKISSAA